MTEPSRPSISLLHATYRHPGGPLEVKRAWVEAADRPEVIEYVLAMDADDVETVRLTESHPRVISPPMVAVSSVRNWNAAAASASGDLLVIVADDLYPPAGWDTRLANLVHPLDPKRVPFAVKVTDAQDESRVLLRHAVISRAFYVRLGLFNPAYHGLFCDNDITTRAFWKSMILDGRSLVFEHRHPTSVTDLQPTVSQIRMNQAAEFERGRDSYKASWSRRRRFAEVRLIKHVPDRPTIRAELALWRWWDRFAASGRYASDRVRSLSRYAVHPSRQFRRVLASRYGRG